MSSKSILFMGLGSADPDFPLPPQVDPKKLDALINSANQSMVDAGFDSKLFLPHMKDGIGALKQELQSKKYDVVLVGVGIRIAAVNTVYFEQIVNTIIEVNPGQKLAFNASLETTLEAAQRAFA